jgi:predicted nucleic acid-binding protein
MFLLDTNVLSAMMNEPLPPPLAAWLGGTPQRFVYTASICQVEIFAGIAILPDGRRRRGLEAAANAMFERHFDDKIWPFDSISAKAYATVFAGRRQLGLHTKTVDLMIAAIALSHDSSVVTRNVRDFDGCGVGVIDPWDD